MKIMGINGPIFVRFFNGIPLLLGASVVNSSIIAIHQQGTADLRKAGRQIQLLQSLGLPEGCSADGSDAFGQHQRCAATVFDGITFNGFDALREHDRPGQTAGNLDQSLSVLAQNHAVLCGVVGIILSRHDGATDAAERIAAHYTSGSLAVADMKNLEVFGDIVQTCREIAKNIAAEIRNCIAGFWFILGIN